MSDTSNWQVELYDPAQPSHRELLQRLMAPGSGIVVHDHLAVQIAELLEVRNPARQYGEAEREQAMVHHLQGTPAEHYGLWAHYPWTRRLVHVLPKHEFQEVRLSRNRNKITLEEQARLVRLRIGVIGLSVGQASALALAREGVGCDFVLADPDRLSLSNVNRLHAAVHDLGINKAVLTARQLLELDPYLDVEVFTEGIDEGNLDRFLASPRCLDMLIEECDDIYIKLRARERARDLRIPVLMETSDRGMLDVERFDLEPARPLLHGRLGGAGADAVKTLSPAARFDAAVKIVGIETMSARAVASGLEVGATLRTWPQLASAVSLGAALVTDTARRIALGEFKASGRFYVDVEQIIRDVPIDAAAETTAADARAESMTSRTAAAPFFSGAPALDEDVRHIIASAAAAPSGGNAQPWRFRWQPGRLLMYRDHRRSGTLLDFQHRATYLALGAAAENAVLAAAHHGYRAGVQAFPAHGDRDLVCEITLTRDLGATRDDLYQQVQRRCTNRRLGTRAVLPGHAAARLAAAAQSRGARLQLIDQDADLAEMGAILGKGDRLRFLSHALHRELVRELRWRPKEAEETRDGIDIRTLELGPADLAALRVTSGRKVMDLIAAVGGGRNLEKFGQRAATTSAAFGLLSIDGDQSADFFQGGRAMQRVWLTASELDLGFQPMAALPYLFMRAAGGGDGLSGSEIRDLLELQSRYRRLLPAGWLESDLLLFRLAVVPPPSMRALRRPLEDMLMATPVEAGPGGMAAVHGDVLGTPAGEGYASRELAPS